MSGARVGWSGARRLTTLTHALAFVGGFALAFVALGATASALGALDAGRGAS